MSIQTFHDVQDRHRRRSLLWLTVLALLYFMALLIPIEAVRFGLHSLAPSGPGLSIVFPQDADPGGFVLFAPQSLLFALLAGAALVGWQLYYARHHAVRLVLDPMNATQPDLSDRYHVRFRNTVDEMAVAAGLAGKVRAAVAPSLALSAFAVEDRNEGAHVGITEGLLSRLTRAQMQAVVAHEISHVREGDAFMTSLTCAMLAPFQAVADMGLAMAQWGAEKHESPPDSGPARMMEGLMRLVCTTLSRRREILADAGAVQLTRNPLALAQALHVISKGNHFLGTSSSTFAPIFVVDPMTDAGDERRPLKGLFASHPPVRDRLELLLGMAHAGFEALEGGPDAESTATGKPATATPSTPTHWMIRQPEGWSSALTTEELQTHPLFSPTAWVTPAGAFSPLRAEAIPALESSLNGPNEPAAPIMDTFETPQEPEAAIEAPLPPQALGDRTSHLCPRCRHHLHEAHYEGVSTLVCPACRGYFVAESKLGRILSRGEKRFPEGFRQRVLDWYRSDDNIRQQQNLDDSQTPEGGLKCPQCQRPMVRRFYNYQFAIPVDRCFDCGSIWFDPNELETLQILVESGTR